MSFPRGKSFLKQILFHSLFGVSIGFGDSVGQFFLKMILGDMSEWEDKKNSGGGGGGWGGGIYDG